MSDDLSAAVECPAAMAGYKLLDKIGEGGMGQVYRAVQRRAVYPPCRPAEVFSASATGTADRPLLD